MIPTWLTIVTAVRDDAPGLRATIDSLREQDLTGVDVLVVDGSRDATSAPALAAGVARTMWAEPRGIYPAMNTGLDHAAGEYVFFLNAGDTLHNPSVLSGLRAQIEQHRPEWLFGPVEIVSSDDTRAITPPWDYAREQDACFARGHFPPHQGTIVRTSLLREAGGFDTSYRIAADYAAFLRLSLLADPLVLSTPIAIFTEGGTSTVNWQMSFREFHRARRSILQPRGVRAVRERLDSTWHFARVFAYREVILRARR